MSGRGKKKGLSIAAGVALVAAGIFAVVSGPIPDAPVVAPEVVSSGQPDVVAVEAVVGEPDPELTICYHRHTGVVIAALPYGHQWGPGENREPLATADVDLPSGFSVHDIPLQRWAYRDGAMVRVPGVSPPVPTLLPPEEGL